MSSFESKKKEKNEINFIDKMTVNFNSAERQFFPVLRLNKFPMGDDDKTSANPQQIVWELWDIFETYYRF